MARRDHTSYLTQVPLFSACTKKELQSVDRHSERVTVPEGTKLTQEGKIGHEFFLVLEGKATVNRNGRDVATLGPGDFFGELALLDRAPRNATVTATTELKVLTVHQREFSALLDTVPTIAHKLLVGLARRIHELDADKVV